MTRNHVTLGIMAAAFALLLTSTDADARGFRNRNRSNGCCQSNYNSGYSYGQHYQRRQNWGNCCSQQVHHAPVADCSIIRPTCCDVQPACNTAGNVEENYETSRRAMRHAPAAPAPARVQEPETDQFND